MIRLFNDWIWPSFLTATIRLLTIAVLSVIGFSFVALGPFAHGLEGEPEEAEAHEAVRLDRLLDTAQTEVLDVMVGPSPSSDGSRSLNASGQGEASNGHCLQLLQALPPILSHFGELATAIGLDPNLVVQLKGGQLMLDHGCPSEALAFLVQALAVEPEQPKALAFTGRALAALK